jgi:Predicted transcriptional regulators
MSSGLLLTGNVASQTGVSVDTVRHYERKGVLHNAIRDDSGYRRYPAETAGRIRIVRQAHAIGFTLDELARVFRQCASGKPPCAHVRDLATRKLLELDERIAAMNTMRTTLSETVTSWEQRLRTTPEGGFARLLESLIH